MRRLSKILLSCVTAALMLAMCVTGSLAATQPLQAGTETVGIDTGALADYPADAENLPSEIGVMVGEKPVDFGNAKPEWYNDSVFVPLDSFFEALGANTAYDEATHSARCSRYDTALEFKAGSDTLTISGKGGVSSVKLSNAPYIKGEQMMVPVREAASAMGCCVGWSHSEQTVLILDAEGLIRSSGAHYTVMDKYIKIGRSEKVSYRLSGTCDMSVSSEAADPLKVSASYTGTSSKDALNMNLKYDFSSLLEAMNTGSDESAKDLAKLKDIELKCILNYSERCAYIQSPYLFESSGMESSAWISVPFSSVLPGYNFIVFNDSFEDYIRELLCSQKLYSKASLSKALALFKQLNVCYSDESFAKEGNTYTTSYKTNENGIANEYSFSITIIGEKVLSYNLKQKTVVSGAVVEVSSVMKPGNYFEVNYGISSSSMNAKMRLDMLMTEDASEKAASKPETGKIYSFEDYFKIQSGKSR